jgi:fatty-acyl-CoA synthase
MPQPILETTIANVLRSAAAEQPDRVALIDGYGSYTDRRRITYGQLLTLAESGARMLAARYCKGTHIAIWSPNSIDWVILQYAAAFAGLPLVMLNPNLRPAEVAYILEHSRSAAVFTTERYRDSEMLKIISDLQPSLPDLKGVFLVDELDNLGDVASELPEVLPGDWALLQYTSGTTGKPKGVLLSHRSIVNIATAGALGLGLPTGSTWLLVLPLASVGGSVFAVLGALACASALVVMREFDPARMIGLIDEEQVAFFNSPPTVHIRLLEHPDMRAASFASLKAVTIGGSIVSAALIEKIESVFGAECLTTYGLTETSGTVALIVPGDSLERKCTTAGRVLPGIEVQIRSPETREPLARNSTGEICVRSVGNMGGYFKMPEATATAVNEEGWLHTGDLGTVDDSGYISITGRLKDMIKRGGHNVYPREIEDVLARHPAVAESAVFGIPHPELGEEIAAAVRLVQGSSVTGEDLREWLFSQIAPHKIPRVWHFVDSFPTNSNGKIQKFELKRIFGRD